MHLSEGESTRLLIQVDWWSLGHNDLVTQHREPLLRQKEVTLRTKHALETKEITSRQMTQVVAPAHSSGQHGNGIVQDESAVNSANYSRRDNTIVTQPLAPGNTAVSPPRVPGNTIVAPPQVPVTNSPSANDGNDQNELEDPELESYVPNKFGTPHCRVTGEPAAIPHSRYQEIEVHRVLPWGGSDGGP